MKRDDALKISLELNKSKNDLAYMSLKAMQVGDFEFAKAMDKAQKLLGIAISKIEKGCGIDDKYIRDVCDK